MFKKMSPTLYIGLTAILTVFSLAYFIGRGEPSIAEGEIGVQLGVPVQHPLLARNGVIALPVVLRLVNRTDTEQIITAPSQCDIFRFIVTYPDNNFIQSRGTPDCPNPQAQSTVLAAGHMLEEVQNIALDAARYQAGDYKLHIRFWGYEADADFELVK